MHVEESGTGDAAIVLLHGMGATGAVWRRAIGELHSLWPGRTVAVDLPGHGRSAPLERYTFAAVADAVAAVLPADGPVAVVGHSFGGAIAALLATGRFAATPAAVVASSVKVNWSEEDLRRAADVAARPPRTFATQAEAEQRYRLVSGLTEDVTMDAADLARGVVEVDGGFRLSQDPPIMAIGDPHMRDVVAAAQRPVLLVRGERDAMVGADEVSGFGVATVTVAGAGHNVHVEDPREFARVIVDWLAASLR